MIFLYISFIILVVGGLVSIDLSLKRKLKNDERIIERLDIIWKEINDIKDKEH